MPEVQDPALAVRVCPTCRVPEMVGLAVLKVIPTTFAVGAVVTLASA
ncbi:hypothetical protein [Tessaracoccus lacteus]|uniref:Uncharacterized protein n=1 Tax=Tessaracoccus lacteus TaxID=3041766 RepID=A0ABY8PVQ5_9ACTN|nr:hypothetical protein [Tessaracoccus sp. T21]WGT46543.1 hypothetical protein QH948_10345 [Tessaracoccus sp. T21]